MKEPLDPKRHPDRLEDALQDLHHTPAPSAEFVEQLEQQLRARHVSLNQQRPATSTWSRLNPLRRLPMLRQHTRAFVSGLVGLALLFILMLGVMALFSTLSQTTAIHGTSTPRSPLFTISVTPRRTDASPSPGVTPTPSGPQLHLQGTGQLPDRFGRSEDSQISLPMSVRLPQPDFPAQVALFNIHTGFEPPSVEVVRRWAEQFGLKSVRVYRHDFSAVEDAGTSGAYIAQGADGREVSLNGGRVNYISQFYDLPVASSGSTPIDPAMAAAAAEAFLKSIPDLIVVEGDSAVTIDHQVEFLPQTYMPGLLFQWRPIVNGIPLLVNEGQILVDYNGQVRSASFAPMRLKLRSKTTTPRPVETVLQDLLDNDPAGILQAQWDRTHTEAAANFQQFQRTSALTVGDEVVLYGYVLHRWALDGGGDQFILWRGGENGKHDFVLEATGLDLAPPAFRRGASVTGHVIGQLRPGLWRVQVDKIERYPDGFNDMAESTGIIRRDPAGAWLEADSGRRYLLPDVPTALPDGAYVSAPGVYVRSGHQTLRLEWGTMTRLSESMNLTSDVASTTWGQYTAAKSGEVFFRVGPIGITPTLPAWWVYEPGTEVTLEGELAASGYRVQDVSSAGQTSTTIFDAAVLTHSPQNPAVDQFPVTLVGQQVNLDLLRLSGFSVRVQGRLLTAEEVAARFPGLRPGSAAVVEITHYERRYPAEVKTILSGKIHLATVAGRQVAILSDTLSRQEYVLSDSLTRWETLPAYEKIVQRRQTLSMIGITAFDRTYGGYPIVRGAESYTDEDGPNDTVPRLRNYLKNPVQEFSTRPVDSPADVVFDRVELAYMPWGGDAIKPIVIYHLTGHSSDNRYTFTYYLKADAKP